MALKKCKECGNDVSTEAKTCPKCGAKAPKKTSLLTWTVAVLFGLWFIGWIVSKPEPKAASAQTSPTDPAKESSALYKISTGETTITGALTSPVMNDLHRQVQQDAMKQYDIAARNGSAMDRCLRAGLAAEAFIQGNDEANYKVWKVKEKADCRSAGIPK